MSAASLSKLCHGFSKIALNSRNRSLPSIRSNHSITQLCSRTSPLRPSSYTATKYFSTAEGVSTTASEMETPPTLTSPQIVRGEDGRAFAAINTERGPKLKPHIIKRRLNKMKTYEGSEKNIRHSPWRLNLVCQLAAGLPLQEALTQLEFCKKSKAPLVQKVLRRTANLADIRHGLQMSQLEVAECFATKGRHLKRVKIMGRGRAGKMEHKHSHFRVILREIDFKLRIYQAPTLNQKKRWFMLQQQAEADAAAALAEREEMRKLEAQAEQVAKQANAKK